MKNDATPSRQLVCGVALITVLIVVAMVSATSSWLLKSQFVSIQRAARVISQEQSMIHTFGIEPLIFRLLWNGDNNTIDYYTPWYTKDELGRVSVNQQELWSKPWDINARNFIEFDDIRALRNVSWKICVQDVGGLIDINALHRGFSEPKGKTLWSRGEFMKTVFFNLFKQSDRGHPDDPDTPTPTKLLHSLMDWLDGNNALRQEGAEKDKYVGKKPPYQPAEMRMSWPEEIHLVDGFRRATTKGFLDVLTALPYQLKRQNEALSLEHKININTAPPEVLRSLPGLDDEDGKDIVEEIIAHRLSRDTPLFTNIKQLCNLPSLYNICYPDPAPTKKDDLRYYRIYRFWLDEARKSDERKKFLGFRSEFFQVAVKVKTGDFSNDVQLLVYRKAAEKKKEGKKPGNPYIVQRRFGKGYYNACKQAKRNARAIKGA